MVGNYGYISSVLLKVFNTNDITITLRIHLKRNRICYFIPTLIASGNMGRDDNANYLGNYNFGKK